MNKRVKITLRALPALIVGGALFFAAVRPTVAEATVPGTNELVSVSSAEVQGGSSSAYPSVSKDGKFVAFSSSSSSLVSGDTNSVEDVFVRDVVSGTTERVSVSTAGGQADKYSRAPRISGDGRYVVFFSLATNLVSGVTIPASPAYTHVYLHDRQNDTTEIVDLSSTGDPGNVSGGDANSQDISEDGRFVVYESSATNLDPLAGDSTGRNKTFVKDRLLNTTKLVSRTTSDVPAEGRHPSISCDGAFITFESGSTSITSGDTNGYNDVFLFQRVGGDRVTNLTQAGTSYSGSSRVSCNGNYVVFNTSAPLVGSDTDSQHDSYVYDRLSNAFERVNVNSGEVAANTAINASATPSISDNGRFVVFMSTATNLDALATSSGVYQIYLRDRVAGTTELVSKNSTPAAGNSSSDSLPQSGPVIEPYGRHVVYSSVATDLVGVDTNSVRDVFIAPTGY
jgi:hypothetical protein